MTSVFRCCIPFQLCSFWAGTRAKNFTENLWVAKDGFNVYSESVPSLATENSRCSFLHDNFCFILILWKKKNLAFLSCKKGLLLFLHALLTSCVTLIRNKLFSSVLYDLNQNYDKIGCRFHSIYESKPI